MSMFTLAISCLTTSNLPWFMDLILTPSSYAILLFTASDFTPITSPIHKWGLFLPWFHLFILSGVIFPLISRPYWAPTNLGSSSFSVLSFHLFILFSGFSSQEYWSGLPFPSPVGHILSEPSTMTHPSWVALHSMAHSFTELDTVVIMWSVWLVFCDCAFHFVCPLMDKRLVEAFWWEGLAVGKTRSCWGGPGHAQ